MGDCCGRLASVLENCCRCQTSQPPPDGDGYNGYSGVPQQHSDPQNTSSTQGGLPTIYVTQGRNPPQSPVRHTDVGLRVGPPPTASTAYAFGPASAPGQSPSGNQSRTQSPSRSNEPTTRGYPSQNASTAAHRAAGGIPPPPSYGSATAPQPQLTVPRVRGQPMEYHPTKDGLPTYDDLLRGQT